MLRKTRMTVLMSIIAIMILLTSSVFALEINKFEDMPENWSTQVIKNAISNGLLLGNNGMIRPDDYLTRAQLATVINRAFGAIETSQLTGFIDVSKTAWYYDEMAKAVQMKTFVGSGNGMLQPDENITREEAFVVLARAFKLSDTNSNSLDQFADKDSIWC